MSVISVISVMTDIREKQHSSQHLFLY